MKDMYALCSSDVRKEWSSVIDSVVREKPAFIKRTRDYLMLCTTDMISQLVSSLTFSAKQYVEDDGSITLLLEELDLAANGADFAQAKAALVNDIIEYAEEYYQEYETYSKSLNRKAHIPYIMKALTAKSPKELEDGIVCQAGER